MNPDASLYQDFLFTFMAKCLFPFYVDDKPVPCGKCPNCRVRHANSWAFRIIQEEKNAISSLWIRLSYDDCHLNRTAGGLATVYKRDVQLFIKRLRRAHPVGSPRIKYYCCGEYGSRFQRPHYHIILLNADERYLADAWRDSSGHSIGEIYIDPRPLNTASICYTVGYQNKSRSIPMFKGDDRMKEFSLMSKRMGLSYLTPQIIDWHLADYSRNYVVLPGGIKSALPRYFADRLFNCWDVKTRLPVKELQDEMLDEATRKPYQLAYDRHVCNYGNADGFIHEQNERRHAAVRNFIKLNRRSDEN